MTDAAVFLASILLGVGIAADAFLAALSNGLKALRLVWARVLGAAVIFAVFHAAAAGIGTVCVRAATARLDASGAYLGAVAAAVFVALGIKSMYEGLYDAPAAETGRSGAGALLAQSLATSADALTAGFVLSEWSVGAIVVGLAVIAVITYAAYVGGYVMGKRFGASAGGGAAVAGGVIFIFMGIMRIV